MAKIELRNISKEYKNGVEAVSNISFTAEDGDFIVLVGPSGCGKTTILRMIAGLEEITEGELLFDGKVINDLEPKDRDIGMVFQEYALYPHFTVFDNIAFPLKIKKTRKEEIKLKVKEVAELTGLVELLHRKPAELSGGQRQRVALARALVREPRFFLFDEPLSNLDAKLRVQMRCDIVNLQKKLGITTIYVTHDQTEAMTMGTKIAILNEGILQQFAPPTTIYNKPSNKFVADFIGLPQINFFEGEITSSCFSEYNSDVKFDIPTSLNISDGKYTIGLRPEKIFVDKDNIKLKQNICKLNVKLRNTEYLGNEVIVYFQTNPDNTKRIKVNDFNENLHIDEEIDIFFVIDDILIFDETGVRIV